MFWLDEIVEYFTVWDQLFAKERARILHLLLEKVEYHAGEVGLRLSSGRAG
jgi:hypothetical protein